MIATRRLPLLVAALAFCAALTAQADTLDTLRRTRTLTIGWVPGNAPFGSHAANGTPQGYTIDLCKHIAADLKARLDLPELKIVYVETDWDTRFTMLDTGKTDMDCSASTMTRDRQARYDFSPAFYVTGTRLLTRKADKIRSIDDLGGQTLAIIKNTTGEKLVMAHNDAASLGLNFIYVLDADAGMAAVREGKAKAFVLDDIILYSQISAAADGAQYEAVGAFLSIEPYGIMMRKGDTPFTKMVSDSLSALLPTAEMPALYQRWFNTPTLNVPLNRLTKETFITPNREPAFP
ncbi:amino acid ABC transporter substrate-binding protein [Denitromonas iodatirespirans]|uniref:Amino acid ABC transporter substrate-binding protein n=1 Tax=Denitromonas iodatirespirans TaxID=2795389 RepID=A0A944D7U8_DENI1|nr:amino acid ABC transporter substrate-binding protein [Denitromonas iodatirespirans]MBT0959623.1 amino acid ABC transporter substrate-binding protein [Denitromonas iodatirespirans]